MTPQEELNQINIQIEELRKRKESIKKDIIYLQYKIQEHDIAIRDLRQSIPRLEQQVEEEKIKARINMSIEEAKQVLSKYSDEEYKQAVEIYFKVIHAKKTLKGLESNNE